MSASVVDTGASLPVPRASEDVTRSVAEFVAGAQVDGSDARLVAAFRRLLVDTAGVMIAGASEPAAVAVASIAGGQPAPRLRPSPDLGQAALVAQVNGAAAHSLDFDDYRPVVGHPSAVLVPCILACRGPAGAVGEDMVAAYAVAYEVWCQISFHCQEHYGRGFHTTATVGTIGAACAAARMLHLTPDQVASAMGIAASLAGGLRGGFGTPVKPFHAGMAASDGIRAVALSLAGLDGPRDTFDSEAGFLAAFLDPPSAEAARRGLGGLSANADVATLQLVVNSPIPKPYPSCGATHGAIDAASVLREELLPLGPDAVHSVLVEMPSIYYADALLYHTPATGLESKFSMEYAVAVSLVGGPPGPDRFTDEALRDPAVRRLVEVVEIVEVDDLNARVAEGCMPARVHLRLSDGSVVSREVVEQRGCEANPMTYGDVWEKFLACLPADARAALAGDVRRVRKMDVGMIVELLEQLLSSERP